MNAISEKPAIPAGYIMDHKGRLIPESMIRPQEMLEDQTVRKILGYAEALSDQIARFKGHTFDDIASFMDLLAEQYGAHRGGAKGNVTLSSIDGCARVQVQVQDTLTFGPELEIAKQLFDACIARWSEGANANVRALVDHAFQVNKEGRVNRGNIFSLRRLSVEDEEWKRAIDALNDSIRTIGSREYVRVYKRPTPRAAWRAVTIDLASAKAPSEVETAK
ncbi:sulfate transporter [Alphaproteobacteria bacterium]|nr:sulfate transporter [Alphaproteobacteria bacterium]